MKPVVKNLDKKLARLATEGTELPLTFRKRARRFVNYKDSCGFNPETGDGHSYGWYALTKVIRGRLVLNTYSYSSSTIKHVNKLMRLFRLLGVKYSTLNAPRGLQDLESAIKEHAYQWAVLEVREKYARKPSKYSRYSQRALLRDARALGLRVTKKLLAESVVTVESRRRQRLDSAKQRRMTPVEPAPQPPVPGLRLITGGAVEEKESA